MIYGIGNDIIEIARVKKSLESERFYAFTFSEAERAAFGKKESKLAGCFAVKEAFGKALGTGVRGFSLDEVSVLRDELGKPYLVFAGAAAAIVQEKNLRVLCALTNTKELAFANVVLEVQA